MDSFELLKAQPAFDAMPDAPPTDRAITDATAKVAHVVLTLEPGGLERLVCDLSISSQTAGLEVLVVCLDTDGRLAPALRRQGVRVCVVPRREGLDPGLVFRLARFFRDEKITVVHTHGPDPMFYGGWAARLAAVPVRIHTQHDTMLDDGGVRDRLKFRLATFAFQHVVAVSGRTHDMLVRHGAKSRLRTIRNGIDEKRFGPAVPPGGAPLWPGERRSTIIGTVARLAPEKALDRLIDAFAVLRQSRPHTRLVIVGDGPERAALEAHAERLGLGGSISFLGHRDDVARVVRQFDVFALSSITEGIPLALLEAMAAGLPAVATAVGGVPEVVTHDESGVLVPSGDPRALLEAIADLVDHPDKRMRLGGSAAARVRDLFSLTRMSSAYRALYHDDRDRSWVRPVRKVATAAVPRTLITWHGSTRGSDIALTLDDGPDPEFTPQILDILRARGVRATFFLVGAKIARHPRLVERIVAEGHELGNHSYDHPHFGALSWQAARRQVVETRRALDRFAGAPGPRLFRPPHGTVSTASTLVPWTEGETVVLWNVDFKDFRAERAADITEQLADRRFRAGDIILYHGHNTASLAALPAIVDRAIAQGLTFVPVARMCQS